MTQSQIIGYIWYDTITDHRLPMVWYSQRSLATYVAPGYLWYETITDHKLPMV